MFCLKHSNKCISLSNLELFVKSLSYRLLMFSGLKTNYTLKNIFCL
jgi:hypothetical protein